MNNPGDSGIGYIIKPSEEEKPIIKRSEYIGSRTNNRAELIALLLMLGDAYCNGIRRLNVYGDSQLIINYMNGTFEVRSPYLMGYVSATKTLSDRFSSILF